MRTWVFTLVAMLALGTSSVAKAQDWRVLGSIEAEPGNINGGTWQVYADNNAFQRGVDANQKKFIKVNIWLELANRPQCYPSTQDCRWRIMESYETHVLYCDGQIQVLSMEFVFDPSYSDGGQQPTTRGPVPVTPGTLYAVEEKALCSS